MKMKPPGEKNMKKFHLTLNTFHFHLQFIYIIVLYYNIINLIQHGSPSKRTIHWDKISTSSESSWLQSEALGVRTVLWDGAQSYQDQLLSRLRWSLLCGDGVELLAGLVSDVNTKNATLNSPPRTMKMIGQLLFTITLLHKNECWDWLIISIYFGSGAYRNFN